MSIRPWIAAGGLVGAFLLVSMGSSCTSFDSYCEEKNNCEDGNEADLDACIVEAEEEEEVSDLYGCDEWFDALFECLELESDCENNNYGPGPNDCDDELADYGNCRGD